MKSSELSGRLDTGAVEQPVVKDLGMKRTPWFSAHNETPKRLGLYECRCTLGKWRADGTKLYWNGLGAWLLPLTNGYCGSNFGDELCDEWRGLAKAAA